MRLERKGRGVRELVYYIATTVDGFIAREDGSFDDFPWDDDYLVALSDLYPETFPAPMRPGAKRSDNRCFDAVLMGRRTYEVGLEGGLTSPYPTLDQFVLSRTMDQSPDPAVTLVSDGAAEFVRELKSQGGRAVWICGGSDLATSLFEAGLIDRVVVKLNPILFGRGIPMFRRRLSSAGLELESSRVFDSGHALLQYAVKAGS